MENQLLDLFRACTVRLPHPQQRGKPGGTGAFVAPGLILTCAHVVKTQHTRRRAPRIVWGVEELEAKILAFYPDYPDVALLRVRLEDYRDVTNLGLSLSDHPCLYLEGTLALADPVYSYVYSDISPVSGEPVTMEYEGEGNPPRPLLKFKQGQIRPGSSGGAVLNLRTGAVCGIIKRTRHRASDIGGRAIPIDAALDQIGDLIKDRHTFHARDTRWAERLTLTERRLLGLVPAPPSPLEGYLAAVEGYAADVDHFTIEGEAPARSVDQLYVPLELIPMATPVAMPSATPSAHLGISLSEALASHQNLVLLGKSGVGKSTLLRYLAAHAADHPERVGLERPYLPIILPLGALARQSGSLERRLSEVQSQVLGLVRDLPIGFFDDWPAESGKPWLILLDALDDVLADDRPDFIEWLSQTLKSHSDHRIILTSRPSAYRPEELNGARFAHFELTPFRPGQIDQFVERWFDEESDRRAFLSELNRVRLGELRSTPLELVIACDLFRIQRTLPDRRAALYERYVKELFRRMDGAALKKELGNDVAALARSVLEHLALALDEHPQAAEETALVAIAAAYLQKNIAALAGSQDLARARAGKMLGVLARRSAIFSRTGTWYAFRDTAFRQYLAACELLNRGEPSSRYLLPIVLSRWLGDGEEVALFLLGIVSEHEPRLAGQLVQSVRRKSLFYRLFESREEKLATLIFVAQCEIDGVSVTDETRTWVREELRQVAGNIRSSADERLAATLFLGRVGNRDEAASLALQMVHGACEGTENGQRAIAVLVDSNHSDELLAVTRDGELDDEVRSLAVVALAHIRAFASLASLGRNAGLPPSLRRMALRLLARSGQVGELEVLAHDPGIDLELRNFVLEVLAEAGRTDALLALMRDDRLTHETQVSAVAALLAAGSIDEVLALARDGAAPLASRQVAVTALIATDEVHLDAIEALAWDEGVDGELRFSCIALLLKRDCLESVLALIRDRGVKLAVRQQAVGLLAATEHGGEAAAIAHDEEVEKPLRVLAATAVISYLAETLGTTLNDLDGTESVEELLHALAGSSEARAALIERVKEEGLAADLRISILDLFIQAGQLEPLTDLVRDEKASPNLRLAIVSMLGKAAQVDALLQLALDGRLHPQLNAAIRATLAAPEQIDRLLALARNAHALETTRQVAVIVLEQAGHVEALTSLVHDQQLDTKMRLFGVRFLIMAGAVDTVLGVIRDDRVDLHMRRCAIAMLKELKHVEQLQQLVDDQTLPDEIRVIASEHLKGMEEQPPAQP